MVCPPKQTRASGRILSVTVISVTIEPRIRGFVNDADDSFALHFLEVDPHQVVVRQIDDAVRRK
jgi:hypothetical protein